MNTRRGVALLRALALSALVVWIGFSVFGRWRRENSSRGVEVCVDWAEIMEMVNTEPDPAAARTPSSLNTLLERLKAMGVSSVAVREEKLDDLVKAQQTVFFTRGEIEKFRAVGVGGDVGVVEIVVEDLSFQSNHCERDQNEEGQRAALGAAHHPQAAQFPPHRAGRDPVDSECQRGNQPDVSNLVHEFTPRTASRQHATRLEQRFGFRPYLAPVSSACPGEGSLAPGP